MLPSVTALLATSNDVSTIWATILFIIKIDYSRIDQFQLFVANRETTLCMGSSLLFTVDWKTTRKLATLCFRSLETLCFSSLEKLGFIHCKRNCNDMVLNKVLSFCLAVWDVKKRQDKNRINIENFVSVLQPTTLKIKIVTSIPS